MNCELNGMKIKYEDGKLWMWREMWRKHKLNVPKWYEVKGAINKSTGYRIVSINKKAYKYHRVVYFIHHQEWDIHDKCQDNSIDHIDRDKLNNSIENLRVVTHSENQWNRGGKGYSFNKNAGKYLARISVECKQKHLGYFVKEEDAHQAYLEAKKIYHHHM